MALALSNPIKKWLVRKVINIITCCFGFSFLRLQIVHSETQEGEKKSPKILAGHLLHQIIDEFHQRSSLIKTQIGYKAEASLLLGCFFPSLVQSQTPVGKLTDGWPQPEAVWLEPVMLPKLRTPR